MESRLHGALREPQQTPPPGGCRGLRGRDRISTSRSFSGSSSTARKTRPVNSAGGRVAVRPRRSARVAPSSRWARRIVRTAVIEGAPEGRPHQPRPQALGVAKVPQAAQRLRPGPPARRPPHPGGGAGPSRQPGKRGSRTRAGPPRAPGSGRRRRLTDGTARAALLRRPWISRHRRFWEARRRPPGLGSGALESCDGRRHRGQVGRPLPRGVRGNGGSQPGSCTST